MKTYVKVGLASLIALFSSSVFAKGRSPRFEKVVYIVLENTSVSQALQNPILKDFANQSVYFSKFMAETRPSQGNYIAMIAGSTFGVNHDGIVNFPDKHFGDLLEAKKMTWKTYAEDFPGNCFAGASAGKYVRKHVPFMSFTNVSQNRARCGNIVDMAKLSDDWSNGRLSNFNLIVPNMDNDGHDTGVDVAADWFEKNIVPFLKDPNLMKDTVVILTFDEATFFGKNQVYTAVFSPNLPMKKVIGTQVNHISLLKWMEDEWSLGNLGREDATAAVIPGF
jgi:phospholipase C